jgi:predicted metal-dependent phosphoesterase TrpH
MWRVDFHTHTVYSPDSLTSPERLVAAARRKGLDRVVVTDHNTIQGARRAQELDPERVIVGEEIMTSQGEILAAFVTQEVPAGLRPAETLARLKAQGAFISVSHPFDRSRKGHWQPEALLKILPEIDAIETFNARCLLPRANFQAQAFASQHGLPGTYGSDAHTALEVGRGSLLLPAFTDAESLRAALRQAEVPALILSTPLIHFSSRFAVWYKRLRGAQMAR